MTLEQTRTSIASTINSGLTTLYWKIGSRISKEILQEERSEYGQAIVLALSRQLPVEYGEGFAEKRLRLMIQFPEGFSDEKVVVHLIQQLSWSHFIELVPIKDSMKRNFYAEMCRVEGCSKSSNPLTSKLPHVSNNTSNLGFITSNDKQYSEIKSPAKWEGVNAVNRYCLGGATP